MAKKPTILSAADLLNTQSKTLIDQVEPEFNVEEFAATHTFNRHTPPPASDSLLYLQGIEVGSRSNIISVTGKSKSRKTAIVSGMMSAMLNPSLNVLGFEGAVNSKDIITHIDTEQSYKDYWEGLDRMLRVAQLTDTPDNFHSLHAREADTDELRKLVDWQIKKFSPTVIVLDGAGDFVLDINENKEVSQFGRYLLKTSTKGNCLVIIVIHTTKTTGYMTGALGTWFEKKSETVFKVDKPEDQEHISNVTCQYARGIPFKPFTIAFDKAHDQYAVINEGQIVDTKKVNNQRAPDNFNAEQHEQVLHKMFVYRQSLPQPDVITAIITHASAVTGAKFGSTIANQWLNYYRDKAFIYCDPDGNWMRIIQQQDTKPQTDLPF